MDANRDGTGTRPSMGVRVLLSGAAIVVLMVACQNAKSTQGAQLRLEAKKAIASAKDGGTEARTLLERCVARSPSDAQCWLQLASVYARGAAGDPALESRAREAFARYLALTPQDRKPALNDRNEFDVRDIPAYR